MKLSAAQRRVSPFTPPNAAGLPTLPGPRVVAVSTDWESLLDLAKTQIRRIGNARPDVRTLFHLGDFRLDDASHKFLSEVDKALDRHNIDRVLVTPGNHDDWNRMNRWWRQHNGAAYRVTPRVWFLRPGTRFSSGSRTVLSFGGASAFDRANQRWWTASMPDARLATIAAESGPVDVLLTHEAVDSPISGIRRIIDGPSEWPDVEIAESVTSRRIVQHLRAQVHPAIALHGHLHVPGSSRTDSGSTVALAGLSANYNAGFLDLTTLTWSWLEDVESR
jgi:hypothetical protein